MWACGGGCWSGRNGLSAHALCAMDSHTHCQMGCAMSVSWTGRVLNAIDSTTPALAATGALHRHEHQHQELCGFHAAARPGCASVCLLCQSGADMSVYLFRQLMRPLKHVEATVAAVRMPWCFAWVGLASMPSGRVSYCG